jgi:hypothetical protein
MRHRGSPLIGHSGPHPIALGLRALAAHVLAMAAHDVLGSDPRLRDDALIWLNSDEGRAMARAFHLAWAERDRRLSLADLHAKRNFYFQGD